MKSIQTFLNSLPDAYQQLAKTVFDDMGEEGADKLAQKLTKRIRETDDKLDTRRKRAMRFEAQVRDTDYILEKLASFLENTDTLGLRLLEEILRDRAERLRVLIEKIEIAPLVDKRRELMDTMQRLKNRMMIAESLNVIVMPKV